MEQQRYLAIGLSVGVGLGSVVGLMMDNLAAGATVGLALGGAIGWMMDKRSSD